MIPADLTHMLRCPQTGQRLASCEPDRLAALNARITQPGGDGVRTQAGTVVGGLIEGGLLRADGDVLYPVRHGIPVLLASEAILLSPA